MSQARYNQNKADAPLRVAMGYRIIKGPTMLNDFFKDTDWKPEFNLGAQSTAQRLFLG